MTFTSPLFLLALLPWLALTIYLLIGRRKRIAVPFVELWKLPVKPKRTTRSLHLPPVAVALLLLALLAALLAAAGPSLKGRADPHRPDPIATTRPVRNIGIAHLAIRERPARQLHLRLRNDSPETSAPIRVSSDSTVILETTLTLPPSATRDYFLDLDADLGRSAAVELLVNDDLAADNRAFLARESHWPRPEPRVPLPPEVQKVLDAYARQRPPSEGSPTILIVARAADLPAGPAVVLAPHAPGPSTRPLNTTIAAHPVTESLEALPALLGDVLLAPPPPDLAAWTSVISIAGRPALLVRDAPARQAYVGFHSDALARSPHFVYLWTNLLDWTAGSASSGLVAHPVESLDSTWSPISPAARSRGPGLYQRGQALRAFNSLNLRPARPHEPSRTAPSRPQPRLLTGPMLLAALALALLSAMLWRRATPDNPAPVQAP